MKFLKYNPARFFVFRKQVVDRFHLAFIQAKADRHFILQMKKIFMMFF